GFALGKPVNPPKVGLLSRSDWTRGDAGLCGGPFLDTAIVNCTDYCGQNGCRMAFQRQGTAT
ncbi:hypothetical protein CE167_08755, partial [Bifidobacterium breve]